MKELKPIVSVGKTISVALSADDLQRFNALREKGLGQTKIFRIGLDTVEKLLENKIRISLTNDKIPVE